MSRTKSDNIIIFLTYIPIVGIFVAFYGMGKKQIDYGYHYYLSMIPQSIAMMSILDIFIK